MKITKLTMNFNHDVISVNGSYLQMLLTFSFAFRHSQLRLNDVCVCLCLFSFSINTVQHINRIVETQFRWIYFLYLVSGCMDACWCDLFTRIDLHVSDNYYVERFGWRIPSRLFQGTCVYGVNLVIFIYNTVR